MNGSPTGLFTVRGSVHDDGTPVSILNSPSGSKIKVNESTPVKCVALFPERSPSERALPVTITGGLLDGYSFN